MIWQQVRVTPYRNLPFRFTTRKAWTVKANSKMWLGPARNHCDIWSCAASSGRIRKRPSLLTRRLELLPCLPTITFNDIS